MAVGDGAVVAVRVCAGVGLVKAPAACVSVCAGSDVGAGVLVAVAVGVAVSSLPIEKAISVSRVGKVTTAAFSASTMALTTRQL